MAKEYFKPGNMLYPVPAVMVSCQSGEERPNIITVAWAGTVCTQPPMLSISVRPERYSYHQIEESGEFVVNLVTKDLVRATDYCGVKSGRDVDKFKETGLTALPSKHIAAPGIAESPVCIECVVKQKLELGSHHMFVAEVVNVTVDDAYMDENKRFRLNASNLVAYSHGEYRVLGELLGTFGYSVQKPKTKTKKKSYKKIKEKKKMDNITLIGMPGAGKSTIGVLLAKAMNYRFVDTDLVIQEQEGKLLCDIIKEEGMERFKEIENNVNAGLQAERSVIAPGGSVVYAKEAMEHFKEIGKVVYLCVSCEEISNRVGDLTQRGVVFAPGQDLYSLYAERTVLYEKYADAVVYCDGKEVGEILAEIQTLMSK